MEYILSIAVFSAFLLLACSLGRKLLDAVDLKFDGAAERAVFAFGTGFGIIAYTVLALGMFGILYKWLFVAIFAVYCLIALPEIKRSIGEATDGLRQAKGFKIDLRSAILALILLVGLIELLGALAPSYSNDSMAYHLTDAKYFVTSHTIGQIPYNSTNALWPYLIEMYFTLAIMFKLLPLAGLFHFSMAIAAAAGIYTFSKRFFSEKLGLLAVIIFMLTPGIFMEAKETYVDLGMVFYTLTAFYSFYIWLEKKQNRWLGLAGAMCGLGLSIKYFMIIVPMILGAYLLFLIIKGGGQKRPGILKGAAVFLSSVFLTSFIWYLRQYIITGNPFFPFFYKIFGTSGIDKEVLGLLSEKTISDAFGIGIGFMNFIILSWQITIFPKKFGGEQVGPVFLAILPVILLIRPVNKNIKIILWFSFAYLISWFLFYQNLRFLLPIVPFLSIVISYIAYSIGSRDIIFRNVVRSAIGISLALSLILCIHHNIEGAKVVLGLDKKDSYLKRNERSYEISEYINKNLPANARILVLNEGHSFFIGRDNVRELYYWIYTRYDKKYKKDEDVLNLFKSKGFTHILYADVHDGAVDGDSRLTSLMKKEEFRRRYLKPIYELTPGSKNANGVKYTVYEL